MRDDDTLLFERSKRLKYLRELAGLTAEQFSQKHGLSVATLRSWEAPSRGALTYQGAQKIIKDITDMTNVRSRSLVPKVIVSLP